MKKYENIGLALIDTRVKIVGNPKKDNKVVPNFYDVKLVNDHDVVAQAFTLTEKELNKVMVGLDILDKKRWGLSK